MGGEQLRMGKRNLKNYNNYYNRILQFDESTERHDFRIMSQSAERADGSPIMGANLNKRFYGHIVLIGLRIWF